MLIHFHSVSPISARFAESNPLTNLFFQAQQFTLFQEANAGKVQVNTP